jgi:hypothetical protein
MGICHHHSLGAEKPSIPAAYRLGPVNTAAQRLMNFAYVSSPKEESKLVRLIIPNDELLSTSHCFPISDSVIAFPANEAWTSASKLQFSTFRSHH